jgi:hypothetical protein
MLKDNDQVRELQRIFARQYMCLEQLRIQLGELASDPYAANEAAKVIGRRTPLTSASSKQEGIGCAAKRGSSCSIDGQRAERDVGDTGSPNAHTAHGT